MKLRSHCSIFTPLVAPPSPPSAVPAPASRASSSAASRTFASSANSPSNIQGKTCSPVNITGSPAAAAATASNCSAYIVSLRWQPSSVALGI